MKDDPEVTSSILPSELVEKTSELVALYPHLPSSQQATYKTLQPLINKIDKLLSLRIKNELRVLELIDTGLVHDDGVVSDKAVALHKSSKDSISELIKVKMMLEGVATENKSVTYRFDANGLLEAIREARGGRIARD